MSFQRKSDVHIYAGGHTGHTGRAQGLAPTGIFHIHQFTQTQRVTGQFHHYQFTLGLLRAGTGARPYGVIPPSSIRPNPTGYRAIPPSSIRPNHTGYRKIPPPSFHTVGEPPCGLPLPPRAPVKSRRIHHMNLMQQSNSFPLFGKR
jgi:hypothetical protein